MDRFDRIFALHNILSSHHTPVSRQDLQHKLECSRATVIRIIEDARDFLGAPIKYDRQRNGYYYDTSEQAIYELPGLWLNISEILALLTTHRLLSEVQPGLLGPYLDPLKKRLDKILHHQHTGSREIADRIRILQMAPRPTDIDAFKKITDSLVRRKRIRILYHGRERDKNTERWISPQQLVYYRDNWYLDAWCHLREALRSFSLDRIYVVHTGEEARDISAEKLKAHYRSSYGIFAGTAKHNAVIRFSSSAARWVADEHWHAQQKSRLLPDGGWELTIPYNDPRELIMDILKYGPEAEVIKPANLREMVRKYLARALDQYLPEKKHYEIRQL